jgi:hypothetical protein
MATFVTIHLRMPAASGSWNSARTRGTPQDRRHHGEFPAIPDGPEHQRTLRAGLRVQTTLVASEAEMTRPTTSTDPLVEALATRLHRVDLVGWQPAEVQRR